MIIAKHFEFEASHQLPNEECYGKCRNLHGHRYQLEVRIDGKVNEKGWVCNFSDIKKIVKERVIDKLDHSHLNDRIDLPTAENILLWIKKEIKPYLWSNEGEERYYLHSLKLYETSNSYAELICV